MSEVILNAILRMPPSLWDGSPLDVSQRHQRYLQAADELDQLREENEGLKERMEELAHACFWLKETQRGGTTHYREWQAAKAKVKDLETQLAGRTYYHSDAAVEARLKKYEEALEKLSRLGNEPHLGNSDGNRIAQDALEELNSEEPK